MVERDESSQVVMMYDSQYVDLYRRPAKERQEMTTGKLRSCSCFPETVAVVPITCDYLILISSNAAEL